MKESAQLVRTQKLRHESDRKQRERQRRGGREKAIRVLDVQSDVRRMRLVVECPLGLGICTPRREGDSSRSGKGHSELLAAANAAQAQRLQGFCSARSQGIDLPVAAEAESWCGGRRRARFTRR